jgi:hypothetical protein
MRHRTDVTVETHWEGILLPNSLRMLSVSDSHQELQRTGLQTPQAAPRRSCDMQHTCSLGPHTPNEAALQEPLAAVHRLVACCQQTHVRGVVLCAVCRAAQA